jgi:hypothetical protein
MLKMPAAWLGVCHFEAFESEPGGRRVSRDASTRQRHDLRR